MKIRSNPESKENIMLINIVTMAIVLTIVKYMYFFGTAWIHELFKCVNMFVIICKACLTHKS